MRKPLQLEAVDLDDLASRVDQHDYAAAYFDPATGEIWPAFEGEVLGPDGEPLDLDDVDWISIGGGSSHEAYQDIETFTEAIGDPALADRLWSALNGKGAFRRFRDEIYRQPEQISRAWNSYRGACAKLRALDWLRDEAVVADAEIDAGATRVRGEAEQALDAVRTATQPAEAVGVDDPMEVLRVLPAERHEQFRAEYAEAIENARRPEEFAALAAMLRLWRLRAVTYSDPGFTERSAHAWKGDTSNDVPLDRLRRR